MTSPYGRFGEDSEDNNSPGGGDQGHNSHNQQGGYGHGELGPHYGGNYGPTNHPEDRPDFQQRHSGYGGQQPPAGYGAPGYGAPGYGAHYGAGGDPNAPAATRETDGKIDVIEAFAWAFRATFHNAKLWLLGTVAYLVVFVILSFVFAGFMMGMNGGLDAAADVATATFGGTDVAVSLVTGAISLAVMPFIYRMALREIDQVRVRWGEVGKDVNYWPTIAVRLVASAVPGLLTMLVLAAPFSNAVRALDVPNPDMIDTAPLVSLLGWLALVGLVNLLIMPFIMLVDLFPVDKRGNFTQAFAASFEMAKRNYVRLLGLYVGYFLLTLVIVLFTFGLGVIVAFPVGILAYAHAFRQGVGGSAPAYRA